MSVRAATSDDRLIYSDQFHNGLGDNWSYIPHYPTSNPVYSGSNSMAFVPNQNWNTWWLKSGTSVDTTSYTNANPTEVNARPTASSPIQLSFVSVGDQLQFNWPADHTSWWLQAQTNSLSTGLGANWFTISGTAATNQSTVPVNSANGAVFFRLARP